MVYKVLVEYISQKLSQGYSLEQIRNSFASTRWNPNDVDVAIKYVSIRAQWAQALVQVHPKYPLQAPEKVMLYENKNVKRAWISTIILCIIILLLLWFLVWGNNSIKHENCGTDMSCFESNASQSCSPVYYDHMVPTEGPGIKEATFFNMSIDGQDGQNCIIDMRIERYNLTTGPSSVTRSANNTPEQTYYLDADMNLTNVLQESLGQTGTCSIPTSNLTTILNSWQSGNLSMTSDFVMQNCRGDIFVNYIPRFGNATKVFSEAFINLSFVK